MYIYITENQILFIKGQLSALKNGHCFCVSFQDTLLKCEHIGCNFFICRIDVDKELKKIDEGDGKGKERTFIANREVTNIPDKIDAKGN